jgi:hypothetical protein
MKDLKPNSKNRSLKKSTNSQKTKEIFLKRIKELDASEQEVLLKLYNEIIKEMK